MAFEPAFLEELRARVSLASVIGRKTKLVKRGREYSGLCPFHTEKSPSFTVNEEKGFFHCFGCGAHGDVIAFEMRVGNLPFPEAVERLATEAGLEIPLPTAMDRKNAVREASLYEVMEKACAFYERQLRLPIGQQALTYLKQRGLDDETIARFRLGFAPEGRDTLKKALLNDSVTDAALQEAGLAKVPEAGGASRDLFRNRIIFPISDRRGRVIAFGGRALGDAMPKYLNSPDTPLFHKGRVLYGLAQARAKAAQMKEAILVEGYMDVIALHRAGFDWAMAPLGTAVTEAQLEEIWKFSTEPTLCFDGDAAGIRAAHRAAERALPILKPGKSLKIVLLPNGQDPDDVLRQSGIEAMKTALNQAKPLHDLLWEGLIHGKRLDSPERQAALKHDLLACSHKIADPDVRQGYERLFLQKLKDLLWQERSAHFAQKTKGTYRPGISRSMTTPKPVPYGASGRVVLSASHLYEKILLATLINHPSLLQNNAEHLGMLTFADTSLDSLRREILKHLDHASNLDSATFRCHLGENGFSAVVDSLLCANLYIHAAFAKPDALTESAREGWNHTYKLYTRKDLENDVLRARDRLAQDASLESFNHILALKIQAEQIGDKGDEAGVDESVLS